MSVDERRALASLRSAHADYERSYARSVPLGTAFGFECHDADEMLAAENRIKDAQEALLQARRG